MDKLRGRLSFTHRALDSPERFRSVSRARSFTNAWLVLIHSFANQKCGKIAGSADVTRKTDEKNTSRPTPAAASRNHMTHLHLKKVL
jgi:hypothetical protein